jgi:3-dehydrosphinganine reductase
VKRPALRQGGHVIVTGGSSGIGLATARRLARAGASLTLLARDPAKLSGARTSLLEAGAPAVEARSVDVSDQPALAAAIQASLAALGPPEALITSAGIAIPGYFMEIEQEVFERTMAVNYFGTLYAIRAVLPAMLARGRGHIVLISSGAGLMGIFGYSAYGPTKFALRGLAETLRAELKPRGVRISIAYPPDTDTPQLAQEDLTKPRETRALTQAGGLWSADGVARQIVSALHTGRFEITPGWEMTLLSRIHSLANPWLQAYSDWVYRRAAE